jgi:hypothetical protein
VNGFDNRNSQNCSFTTLRVVLALWKNPGTDISILKLAKAEYFEAGIDGREMLYAYPA